MDSINTRRDSSSGMYAAIRSAAGCVLEPAWCSMLALVKECVWTNLVANVSTRLTKLHLTTCPYGSTLRPVVVMVDNPMGDAHRVMLAAAAAIVRRALIDWHTAIR